MEWHPKREKVGWFWLRSDSGRGSLAVDIWVWGDGDRSGEGEGEREHTQDRYCQVDWFWAFGFTCPSRGKWLLLRSFSARTGAEFSPVPHLRRLQLRNLHESYLSVHHRSNRLPVQPFPNKRRPPRPRRILQQPPFPLSGFCHNRRLRRSSHFRQGWLQVDYWLI